METPRNRYARTAIERALVRISDTNRPLLVQYMEEKRGAGVRLSSLKLYSGWIQRLDAHISGRPFTTLAPQDLSSFFADLRTQSQPGTVEQAANQLRVFVNWLLGDATMPKTMRRAFKILRNADLPDLEPATDDEMHKLLHNLNNLQETAVVATLRDSGFRISELMALNVGSVEFDERGGARLRIPAKAADLKTGPRTVYVHRAAGYLRAHLHLHPQRDDPGAPLFVGRNKRGVTHRMIPTHANTFMARACARAGLRRIWPHLLRHTRVTEAAVNKWNEAQMRTYFGWSKTSRMPAHYTHYHLKHMEAEILREAGVSTQDAFATTQPRASDSPPIRSMPADLLAAALVEVLRRGASDASSNSTAQSRRSGGWDTAEPTPLL